NGPHSNAERAPAPTMRPLPSTPRLEQPNPRQWQDPLEDCRQADQHHEQFEKACQTAILDKFIDGPKANRTDDANNQDSDQGYKHRETPSCWRGNGPRPATPVITPPLTVHCALRDDLSSFLGDQVPSS